MMNVEQIQKIVSAVSVIAMYGNRVCIEYSLKDAPTTKGGNQVNSVEANAEMIKLDFMNRSPSDYEVGFRMFGKVAYEVGQWLLTILPYATMIWLAYIAKDAVKILKGG